MVKRIEPLLADSNWWAEPTVTGDHCLAVHLDGHWTYKADRGEFIVSEAITLALGEFLLPAMVFDGQLVDDTLWLTDLAFAGLVERPVVSPCDPFRRRRVALEECAFSLGWTATSGPVRLVPRFTGSCPKRALWERTKGRVTFRHMDGVYGDTVLMAERRRRDRQAG